MGARSGRVVRTARVGLHAVRLGVHGKGDERGPGSGSGGAGSGVGLRKTVRVSLFGGASSEVRRCICSVVDESRSSLAARCVSFYQTVWL